MLAIDGMHVCWNVHDICLRIMQSDVTLHNLNQFMNYSVEVSITATYLILDNIVPLAIDSLTVIFFVCVTGQVLWLQ